MTLKKAFAGATAIMILTSILASCGGNGEESSVAESSAASSTSSADTSTAGTAEKVNDIMYAEGLPIVDPGDYTFSLFVDDSQDDDLYVMFPILEEQTGVKVELQVYPNAIATERLNLALNSGDYADCIGGWVPQANDILTHGVEEQLYVPLDSYFEDYCPKITELLELEGVRDTMTAPDGHIYSIPYVLEAPAVPFNPFVNTDWLENVGMEMPTTTDELTEVLRAFKEQDANGNGDPNDEIPFTVGPDNKHLGDICGWFGMSVNDEGFTMVGDQLTFGANTEEYKNGIKYLAGLYAEGLIDPEMFTQDSSQWKGKGAQDIYGVVTMYASSDIMPYEAGEVPHWEPLPVLSSPECSNPVYLRDTYGNDVLKHQVVITDNAEHPEIICRWWDNLFELENSLQTQAGPLGVTLIKEDDGTYTQIAASSLPTEEEQKEYWGNLWPQALPKYIPAGFEFNQDPVPYDEKAVVDELYEPYLTEAIPDVWVSIDDTTRMADLSTAIKDYVVQKQAQWISGQADIDAEWDSYCEQLDRLGLQELIEIRTNAINNSGSANS